MDRLPPATKRHVPHPVLDRLPHLRQAAERQGIDCLDDTWIGHHQSYRFRCQRGHIFQRTMTSFSPGQKLKCQQCIPEEYWSKLNKLAAESGVQCLEEEWLGRKTLHRFQCSEGHAWTRMGHRALGNADCPRCVRSPFYARLVSESWQNLHEVTAQRGGQVLTAEADYVGTNHTYLFRCGAGHEWRTPAQSVLSGTWCPQCDGLRKAREYLHQDGLQRLHDAAAAQGGQCLSSTYEGVRGKYRFRCAQGHEWETLGYRVVRGGWCLWCNRERQRLTLDDAHATARARGGQCLSQAYIRCHVKLHWLCHRGHSWHATYASVRRGTWCAQCAHLARIPHGKVRTLKRYKVVPV